MEANCEMSFKRWKNACKAGCNESNYRREHGLTETRVDSFVDGVRWADEHPAETQWHSTDDCPKDKEPILMKLYNGKYQYGVWEAEGYGFFNGLIENAFFGSVMKLRPIKFGVVAWRSLVDVINEQNGLGIL